MKRWIKTAAAVALSLALYLVLFSTVLNRPVRMGGIATLYQMKIDYAEQINEPKIVVSAGSSGLYGVRCELLETSFGLPCVNMSIQAEMGMMGILEFARRAARPGDVVLLPIEYSVYSAGGYGDTLRQYAITYDRDLLLKMPLERIVWSAFYFDLKYVFSALLENWLYYVQGERAKWGTGEGLTRQGDLQGHSAEEAERFRDYLDGRPPSTHFMQDITPDAEAFPLLVRFLRWATQHNIRVIGTLPPTFDSGMLDGQALQAIVDVYRRHGHEFIILSNEALYPRHCFYDTPDHLNEECQAVHTRLLARAVAPFLPPPAAQESLPPDVDGGTFQTAWPCPLPLRPWDLRSDDSARRTRSQMCASALQAIP